MNPQFVSRVLGALGLCLISAAGAQSLAAADIKPAVTEVIGLVEIQRAGVKARHAAIGDFIQNNDVFATGQSSVAVGFPEGSSARLGLNSLVEFREYFAPPMGPMGSLALRRGAVRLAIGSSGDTANYRLFTARIMLISIKGDFLMLSTPLSDVVYCVQCDAGTTVVAVLEKGDERQWRLSSGDMLNFGKDGVAALSRGPVDTDARFLRSGLPLR